MDDECITISDDEDCQLIEHVVNLEPIVIDLTDGEESINGTEPVGEASHSQGRCLGEQGREPTQDQAQQYEPSQEPSPKLAPGPEAAPRPAKEPAPKPPPSPPKEPAPELPPSPPKEPAPEPPPSPPKERVSDQSQESGWPAPKPAPYSQRPMCDGVLHSEPFRERDPTWRTEQARPTGQARPMEQARPADRPKPSDQPQSAPQQKHIMSDHELMEAQKKLGNEKYRHSLFDEAIRTYKRANELAKKLGNKDMSAILHFNLAMTYYKLGSYDQAADECANAVKINDNYTKAHLKRAEIYQRQCKFDEAVICYEHICELDSTNQDYAILLKHAREAARHTKKKDYYQLLGLNSNSFTREDLKRAYRQQALNHHPDRHSDADTVTRRIEEKCFKEASEAHTFIQLRLGYRR